MTLLKNWKSHIFKSLTTDSFKPPLKCGNVGAEKDKPTRLMNLQFKKKEKKGGQSQDVSDLTKLMLGSHFRVKR